jgi:outer membrane protein assembly factor BamB
MAGVWPQRRYGGGRTGYNPDASGVPSGIDERLSFELPSGYDETVSVRDVLVAPDEYVASGSGTVAGHSRADGSRNWSRSFDYVTGEPVLDGRWLVVGSHDQVHGVERAYDRTEWVKPLSWQAYGVVSDLAVQNGAVYVGGRGGSENEEGSVAVLDPSSGSLERERKRSGIGELFVTDEFVLCNWHSFFSGGLEAIGPGLDVSHDVAGYEMSPEGPDMGWTPRVVANGYVYGTDSDATELVAVELPDGTESWRQSIDDGSRVRPVVIRDILYCWDASGLMALNSYTGDVLWRCREASRAETGYHDDAEESMVAALSSLVVGGDRPMAVDPDTGDVLWTRDDPFTVHALVDDELVASSAGEILVFRDTESSGTEVYGTANCPSCGVDLAGRGDPSFCPDCGTVLDG